MRLHLEAVMNRNNCELLFTENLREWYRHLKLYGLQSKTSGRNVLFNDGIEYILGLFV